MAAPRILIGIDEAGYGPLLGPLCVGAAAFERVDRSRRGEHAFGLDLRGRLAGVVSRVPRGRSTEEAALPVPVDDSKRLKTRYGLPGLARAFGLFSAGLDVAPPADLPDLLFRHSDRLPASYEGVPWFDPLARVALPRYPWGGPQREAFLAAGLRPLDLRVHAVDTPELNRDFAALRNKARALGLYTATLVASLLDRFPEGDALVLVDRHGGRKSYGRWLSECFPFASVEDAGTVDEPSRYVLRMAGREVRFAFLTKGDTRSLAVGWASVAAKLTRDLFMHALSDWFIARQPDLRPTAGYVSDGRRFLAEVAPTLEAEGIDPSLLVRER